MQYRTKLRILKAHLDFDELCAGGTMKSVFMTRAPFKTNGATLARFAIQCRTYA